MHLLYLYILLVSKQLQTHVSAENLVECFEFVGIPKRLNWFHANDYCRNKWNGSLVTNDEIYSILQNDSCKNKITSELHLNNSTLLSTWVDAHNTTFEHSTKTSCARITTPTTTATHVSQQISYSDCKQEDNTFVCHKNSISGFGQNKRSSNNEQRRRLTSQDFICNNTDSDNGNNLTFLFYYKTWNLTIDPWKEFWFGIESADDKNSGNNRNDNNMNDKSKLVYFNSNVTGGSIDIKKNEDSILNSVCIDNGCYQIYYYSNEYVYTHEFFYKLYLNDKIMTLGWQKVRLDWSSPGPFSENLMYFCSDIFSKNVESDSVNGSVTNITISTVDWYEMSIYFYDRTRLNKLVYHTDWKTIDNWDHFKNVSYDQSYSMVLTFDSCFDMEFNNTTPVNYFYLVWNWPLYSIIDFNTYGSYDHASIISESQVYLADFDSIYLTFCPNDGIVNEGDYTKYLFCDSNLSEIYGIASDCNNLYNTSTSNTNSSLFTEMILYNYCTNIKLNMSYAQSISTYSTGIAQVYLNSLLVGECDMYGKARTQEDACDLYQNEKEISNSENWNWIECRTIRNIDIDEYFGNDTYRSNADGSTLYNAQFEIRKMEDVVNECSNNNTSNNYFYGKIEVSCEVSGISTITLEGTSALDLPFGSMMYLSGFDVNDSNLDDKYDLLNKKYVIYTIENGFWNSDFDDTIEVSTELCYAITFSHGSAYSIDPGVDFQGLITIYLDDEYAGFNGFYEDISNPNILCPFQNDRYIHASRCIIPDTCKNKQVYLSRFEASKQGRLLSDSFHSLDSSLFASTLTGDIDILCDGGYSCVNSIFSSVETNDGVSIYCLGAFSCTNITLNNVPYWGSVAAICLGMESGNGIKLSGTYAERYGLVRMAGFHSCYKSEIYLASGAVYVSDSFSIVDCIIYIDDGVFFDISTDFGIYNSTLTPMNSGDNLIDISLSNHEFSSGYEYQYFTIRFDSFTPIYDDYSDKFEDSGAINYNQTAIDNSDFDRIVNIHDSLSELISDSHYDYDDMYKNNSKSMNNYNIFKDIGWPLFFGESIESLSDNGSIYCRGYQSCAYTTLIQVTQYANINCIGDQSCFESDYILTSDIGNEVVHDTGSTSGNRVDDDNGDTIVSSGNIRCLGRSSCYDSLLEASNAIVCAADYSCSQTFALGAKEIYCTTNACNQGTIRSVPKIYILGQNTGVTAFTSDVNQAYLYIYGGRCNYGTISYIYWATVQWSTCTSINYYCNSGATCYIECGRNSCNKNNTKIYCYGKCVVDCKDSTDCVDMVESLAPSSAPTSAPTNAPTVPPTNTPTSSPTGENLGLILDEKRLDTTYNGLLIGFIVFSIILIAIAIIDATRLRKDELFQWTAIVSGLVYMNDFLSDVFFCLKLSAYAFGNQNSLYTDWWLILFIASLTFIILPMVVNTIQLNAAILSWSQDIVLQHTPIPQCMFRMRLFLFSVI